MSTKSTRKSTAEAQLPSIVATFWNNVEQRCMLKGVPILEQPYYGLRPEDRIQMTVGGGLHSCTISELWRRYSAKMGINADLFTTSQLAVAQGLLKSSNRKGKDAKTGQTRNFGVQFWTPSNTVYLSKKPAGQQSGKVTPEQLVAALLGDDQAADEKLA